MTLKIGDRVYHKNHKANGVVIDVDNSKIIHKYKVQYFWAKYCNISHGSWDSFLSEDRKWEFCSANNLIKLDDIEEQNKVRIIKGRSLDRLISNVCEVPTKKLKESSDVIISYGQWKKSKNMPKTSLVLNRHLTCNKYKQALKLGALAPMSVPYDPNEDDGWIAKPYYSFGGRDIYHIEDDTDFNPTTHYAQKEFMKIREFRAHCFLWSDNPVPLIHEKIMKDKGQWFPLCWNKHQGAIFRIVYQENNDKVKYADTLPELFRDIITDLSVKALKRLHYDFGGVDLAVSADGNWKVFEVNSRSGLHEDSLFTYKQMFNKLKKLDINKYKEGRWVNDN